MGAAITVDIYNERFKSLKRLLFSVVMANEDEIKTIIVHIAISARDFPDLMMLGRVLYKLCREVRRGGAKKSKANPPTIANTKIIMLG